MIRGSKREFTKNFKVRCIVKKRRFARRRNVQVNQRWAKKKKGICSQRDPARWEGEGGRGDEGEGNPGGPVGREKG